jgi:hypothetical protein
MFYKFELYLEIKEKLNQKFLKKYKKYFKKPKRINSLNN